jgi:hypothetical protein
MNRTLRSTLLFAVSALALAMPRHAAALEITPFVGVVHPLKPEFLDLGVPLVIDLEPSTAYGIRLGGRVTPRIGLEASLAGSGANLRVIGNALLESSGTLFEGDGRARFRLNSPGASQHFDLIGGVGMSDAQFNLSDFLNRTGLKRKARVTWVGGLGATLAVFPSAALRVDLEDHISPTHLQVDQSLTGVSYKERTQHDLMFTMGVVVPLGQR